MFFKNSSPAHVGQGFVTAPGYLESKTGVHFNQFSWRNPEDFEYVWNNLGGVSPGMQLSKIFLWTFFDICPFFSGAFLDMLQQIFI